MPRRETINKTNIGRIAGITPHEALVAFICIRCSELNFVNIGTKLLTPTEAYETQSWTCQACGFVHSKASPLPTIDLLGKNLPFSTWGDSTTEAGSIPSERFWLSFFTIATESKESYWKQCNTCGRKLPSKAFSGHSGWRPLEKQMECRSCKAVINANLNPKRTKEQLHESASRRRTADLLLTGKNERTDIKQLFERFGGKCFKTGKVLDINDRRSWAIDHILPSKWLYPLNPKNAALLSTESNNNKRDKWPSEFYSNNELKQLASITGADLELISSKTPIVNTQIDVDACVSKMLTIRSATDMTKRIKELKKLLDDYNLVQMLSESNKKLLGYSD